MSEQSSQPKLVDSYLNVQLDEEELFKGGLNKAFITLHSIGKHTPIEVRIVAENGRVEYYFGAQSDRLRAVKKTLTRVFPEGVDITPHGPPMLPEEPVAALEFRGRGERRDDWQTGLRTRFDGLTEQYNYPLAAVVDTLADTDGTVVYQAMFTPKPDWRAEALDRKTQLLHGEDTMGQRLFSFITNQYNYDATIDDVGSFTQDRINAIDDAHPKFTFGVSARAIADGMDAIPTLSAIGSAFGPLDGQFYGVETTVRRDSERVEQITERIATSEIKGPQPLKSRVLQRLPITGNLDPEIVTDLLTAPQFCLFDGDSLTSQGRRAMSVTPAEQTSVMRPHDELLEQYNAGMLLGYPLSDNNTPIETPVELPPSLQSLHAAWFGKTGSGKSTSLINAMLTNQRQAKGADILIDPKGDGMPADYLKAHYAKEGSLENVYYFDCAETLPAISFFDIRGQLDAGIDRSRAIEDVTEHYIEMLIGIMGEDRFERAVRSPDIIRYLVKALFDPVHGNEAFSHSDLQEAATRMRETRDAPPVVDSELQRMLSGVASNSKRSFDELMQGVANRIEKIPLDDRLGELFNHVPLGDEPRFDLREIIDEDAVVIINTGGLRRKSRRVITLVLLSQLWDSLRRRTQQGAAEPPLVNLYIEEAASVASSGLITDLLTQSRSFGLSVTLAMQYPGQLRETDEEAYVELINNVSSIVTGNVSVDDDLRNRMTTEKMGPNHVANRLGAMERGQWLVSLPSYFGRPEPRPFLVESAAIPAGHPESDEPLSSERRTAFEAAYESVRSRTRLEHGIDIASARHSRTKTRQSASDSALPETSTHPDSVLPHTRRLPDVIKYDDDYHALLCVNCNSRYDPTRDGIERAIECCHSLEAVDRDDVPICSLSLKLSEDERLQSRYSDAQFRLLHAVYAAHQLRFDPELEYDIVFDSMIRLQEYVGIETDAVDELLEDELLTKDCQYPHTLYTVTPAGRKAAKIKHREGIAHGDGVGDLSESSFHVAMIQLGIRFLQITFVESDDSPAVEVRPYYEVSDGRLDVAALDADGEVVVTLEAERSNNDTRRAVPDDYDKMAAEEPEEAIWIVKNRDGAHDVLDALNEPPEGDARVEKTYSRSSPPQRFNIDTPGLSQIYTFSYLRDSVLGAEPGDHD